MRPVLILLRTNLGFFHDFLGADNLGSPRSKLSRQIGHLVAAQSTRQNPRDVNALFDFVHGSLHELDGKGPHNDPFHLLEWDFKALGNLRKGERSLRGGFGKNQLDQSQKRNFFFHLLAHVDECGLRGNLGGIGFLAELLEVANVAEGAGLEEFYQPGRGGRFQHLENGVADNLSEVVNSLAGERRQAQIYSQGLGLGVGCGRIALFGLVIIEIIHGLVVKGFGRTHDFVIGHGCLVVRRIDSNGFRCVGNELLEQGTVGLDHGIYFIEALLFRVGIVVTHLQGQETNLGLQVQDGANIRRRL
mmetsp:Transcript_7027/g.17152  ORF Transcript_7027/g.17152 Transcript_7027/m.17152 type:complete len:303 (+) Transcript_7027:46-954(+)